MSAQLEDGQYDVIIVDANDDENGAIAIECAVSSGPHRGEVVALRARGLARGWMDLLATPATLTITRGEPTLTLD